MSNLIHSHSTSDGDTFVLQPCGEYVDIYSINRSTDEPCITVALEDMRHAVNLFDHENELKKENIG